MRKTIAEAIAPLQARLKGNSPKAAAIWAERERLRAEGYTHEDIMVLWGKPVVTEGSSPAPSCPVCDGAGWIYRDLPLEHPDRGQAFRCDCKKAGDIARLFDGAEVPDIFKDLTLDTFPWCAETEPQRKQLAAWMLPGHTKKSLLLSGLVGRGKTGLAVGLLKLHTQRRTTGLFITVANLMDKLRETQRKDVEVSEKEVLERVKQVPFLVLDDIGRERPTPFQTESLFKLVDHRYSWAFPTVYTTNMHSTALGGHLGAATASRIGDSCLCLELTGENLRNRAFKLQPKPAQVPLYQDETA